MSLFTELMTQAKSYEEGHANLATIEAKYAKLDLSARKAFIEEARQYIDAHGLKAKLNSKVNKFSFEEGVFVYQAAIMQEINELQGQSPKSEAAQTIINSPSFVEFLKFTSKTVKHTHPDGIYGTLTDSINTGKGCPECLSKMMDLNAEARERAATAMETAKKQAAEAAAKAASVKPVVAETPAAKASEEPKKAVVESAKTLHIAHWDDFNKSHTVNKSVKDQGAYEYQNAFPTKQYNFGAAADLQWDKPGQTIKAGVELNNTYTQTVAANPVTLARTTSVIADGELVKKINLSAKGNGPELLLGGNAGIGGMTSKVESSNVARTDQFVQQKDPLAATSTRTSLAFKGGVIVGLNETDKLPGAKVTADAVWAPGATASYLKAGIFKTFNVGKNGGTLTGEVNIGSMPNYIIHNEANPLQSSSSLTNPDHGLAIGGKLDYALPVGKKTSSIGQ